MTDGMASDRARLAVGFLLAAVGVATGLEASTFDVGFMTDPLGPKALPYLVAVMLVLSGAHALVSRSARIRSWPVHEARWRIASAGVAFVVYAVLLPFVGFFLATTLVVATLSVLFGARPRRAAVVAAALSGALWALFVYALTLPLPIGDLWIR